ncbi:hypothetical protein GGH94_004660 [Coemansia aciculifera]|uniref:Bromo domain-containing protein n=1 Tax=Coemansia aciculifera TaxID=417176 RepID=A0A9W8INT7_9FUNG|nr:hypothetical protein GGH94_004660 [Coemansia aciculifera]KAJ2871728.1 hypothetical protein GGH93_004593 [Coemansia aciculifera]
MPLNAISPDSYTTRDRLVVLSLAAVLGAKDWDKMARVLNSSFQPSSPGGAREYTHNDCVCIYQDAIKRVSDSGSANDENALLYESLYNLKGRRLDEIQERLEHIALAIEELGTQVDSADSHLESSVVDAKITRTKAGPRTNGSLAIASQEADTSRQAAEIGEAGFGDELAAKAYSISNPGPITESRGKLLEIVAHTTIAGEAECVTETGLATQQNGSTSEVIDEAHSRIDADVYLKLPATSKPQSPATTNANFSNDGDSTSSESDDDDVNEPLATTFSFPSQPVGGSEFQAVISDSVRMGGGAVHDQTPVEMEESAPADSHGAKAAAPSLDEQQIRNWKKNINTVWRDISGHRLGSMFISPIKSADAPNYYEVIRQPLDLKTIKNRIRDDEIATTIEFYRDIMHMLMNALMYNAEDTEVYQMTMEIIPDAQACIEQLLQTEAAVNQPLAGGNSGHHHVGTDDDDTSAMLSAPAPAPAPPSSTLAIASVSAVSGGDDGRADETQHHHEADDSDSSVPTKRRRRVASERASKHLRS